MLYRFYDSFREAGRAGREVPRPDERDRVAEFLAGFCYTQLTDIEQEINGLLTYDRQPKVPAEEIAHIHREMLKAK